MEMMKECYDFQNNETSFCRKQHKDNIANVFNVFDGYILIYKLNLN